MAHIFLDESGQFNTHKDGKYFIVGSFITKDPSYTKKKFRSWQQRKFPKKMRNQPEIKWSDIKITNELRLATLKFISNLNIGINFSYLLRKNIPSIYIKNKRIDTGTLYTHVIGETLSLYLPIQDQVCRIFCDKRHLKGITHTQFFNILQLQILPELPANTLVQIEMIDSMSNANIQIADWIAGAIASYIENKPLGKDYYHILKSNLLCPGKELFPDSRNITSKNST
ncbi:MAG: DUF3800 domain-containing protein [Candidatus Magasanikbacteria bacterium]|nr:DUF3800 domain-containing protein [Candidatus Magasanikbacteria bacterium]